MQTRSQPRPARARAHRSTLRHAARGARRAARGCYRTGFKMGMPHTGYEGIGCEIPESNFLDDGPSSDDDPYGELYYR